LRCGIGVARVILRLRPSVMAPPLLMVDEFASDLEAVITLLAERGLVDPQQLAVGGHCLGAYAATMLLARTSRFRAGIASAGRYNLASLPLGGTLTAHRPLHEAPELHVARSVFTHAAGITAPLLLLHGEQDDFIPPGCSEDLFRAVARNGGRCRYVRLPYEGHVYRTRRGEVTFEAEIEAWCKRYLAGFASGEQTCERNTHEQRTEPAAVSFRAKESSPASTESSSS
jgi:dipeptidyl aminopeptidase/acylaminoacyl peptidase